MPLKKDLKSLGKPYYWLNILMCSSYLIIKKIPYICDYVFTDPEMKCQFNSRESEILLFLLIVIMIRSRKSGSVTMLSYLSTGFMYSKIANMVLWFYCDIRAGILYTVLFIVLGIWLPEPTYDGPSNVKYFRTAVSLEDEIARDKHICWLICFYTVWNPSCTNFAPIFAQLSAEYALDNLKFGKIDVGRYPDAANKYAICDSSTSRQLPTLILFKNGVDAIRRPLVDNKSKVVRFFFTEDNVKLTFDLNNLHRVCKAKLPKKVQKNIDDELKKKD